MATVYALLVLSGDCELLAGYCEDPLLACMNPFSYTLFFFVPPTPASFIPCLSPALLRLVSLYSSASPGTYYIDQNGLEFAAALLL